MKSGKLHGSIGGILAETGGVLFWDLWKVDLRLTQTHIVRTQVGTRLKLEVYVQLEEIEAIQQSKRKQSLILMNVSLFLQLVDVESTRDCLPTSSHI